MEATHVDHAFVAVDEFDALSVQLNVPGPTCQPSLRKKYPAKWHARKVAKGLGSPSAIIYLPGQTEKTWEDSDQGPPFRQRRYFYYMSGANFPGCSATYDIESDKLTLWIPYTPPATILWFGKTPTPDDCLARLDVHDVKYVNELSDYLASRLSSVKTLYALRVSQLPKFDGFGALKPRLIIDTTSLQPVMDEARMIKSEYEIDMIRKANNISSEAHGKVASQVHNFVNECEIEAMFSAECTAQNTREQSYPIIAGSGANASTLHYEANNESLEGRQLVILDAGAEWDCYASDVTRTLPLGPKRKLEREAKSIYDLVHQMQLECIQRIEPGVVFRNLQLHASLVAVKGLLQLGIFRGGTADEIFKNGTIAAFFPHGLGHHVGLDVHDVLSRDLLRLAGDGIWGKRRPIGPQTMRAMIKQAAEDVDSGTVLAQSSLQVNQRPNVRHDILQPNMVVTVEPGIYFCRPYIEAYFLQKQEHRRYIDVNVLEKYWDVGGVRIEDCILVTEDGYENLTTVPKGADLLKIVGC